MDLVCGCRFKATEGRKVHESDTCLVIIVEDVKLKQKIALKLMANKEQWQRELSLRRTEGGAALDKSHIIAILDSLVDEGPSSVVPFILVMPAAEQDLSDFLSHSPMAGSDWQAVAAIMRQLAEHLQYLHVACNSIHSDVKPRNIVKLDADGIVAWILIDLDAACKRGTPAGQKMTSSSKLPPELARYALERANKRPDIEMVTATEQLDIWCAA